MENMENTSRKKMEKMENINQMTKKSLFKTKNTLFVAHSTLFSHQMTQTLYFTAFMSTVKKKYHMRLENMLLGQLKMGERPCVFTMPMQSLSFHVDMLT